RLNRLPIFIPALKDRMADLPQLIDRMILKVNQLYGRQIHGISESALLKLQTYDWPGNVRELENVISRSAIFMDITDEIIQYKHLPTLRSSQNEVEIKNDTNEIVDLQTATDSFEKQYIKEVYQNCQHNKTLTAKQLNISVRSLYYK